MHPRFLSNLNSKYAFADIRTALESDEQYIKAFHVFKNPIGHILGLGLIQKIINNTSIALCMFTRAFRYVVG